MTDRNHDLDRPQLNGDDLRAAFPSMRDRPDLSRAEQLQQVAEGERGEEESVMKSVRAFALGNPQAHAPAPGY